MNDSIIDDMEGIDDYPPERVAHDAAQSIKEALQYCVFKSSDQWFLIQAMRVLNEKAGA